VTALREKKTIDYIIEHLEKRAKEDEYYRRKLEVARKVKEITEKRLRGEEITAEDVGMAMKLTCWGSFAGCCSYEKRCPFYYAACEAIGVSPEALYKAKDMFVQTLLAFLMSSKAIEKREHETKDES